jgi:2-dehydro-3-deoxyphosphogluconate aldolase/(4S)-4-hydroxy-2-oxoglutarate aldolase
MRRTEVVAQIKQIGIIPALRSSNTDEAARAAEAILQGGIPIVEISLALPNALNVLESLAKRIGKRFVVGAGTVITRDEVRSAKSAGAQFIVTPGFDSGIVAAAVELELAIFVGALTPTEVQEASASGPNAVKLFPCYAMGGPRYLKSLRSQYPQSNLIASGGVSLDNCSDYIRAGAWALGIGGEIADSGSSASGDQRVFTVRARRFVEAVKEARTLWVQLEK